VTKPGSLRGSLAPAGPKSGGVAKPKPRADGKGPGGSKTTKQGTLSFAPAPRPSAASPLAPSGELTAARVKRVADLAPLEGSSGGGGRARIFADDIAAALAGAAAELFYRRLVGRAARRAVGRPQVTLDDVGAVLATSTGVVRFAAEIIPPRRNAGQVRRALKLGPAPTTKGGGVEKEGGTIEIGSD